MLHLWSPRPGLRFPLLFLCFRPVGQGDRRLRSALDHNFVSKNDPWTHSSRSTLVTLERGVGGGGGGGGGEESVHDNENRYELMSVQSESCLRVISYDSGVLI